MRPIIQKSGFKVTGAPTRAEKARMDWIAGFGCILSFHKTGIAGTPAVIHHLLTGRVPGRRSGHMRTIALAPRYHDQSPEALHTLGLERFAQMHGITEEQLFDLTNEQMRAAA